MKKLNTRVRILIVTAIVALAYFFTSGNNVSEFVGLDFNYGFDPIRHIFLGIIVYLGTYWALFGHVSGERLITILLFPALGLMAGSFFTELIINFVFSSDVTIEQVTFQIFSTGLVSLFTYINILTVNLLNAHYYYNIPLGQAAKAAYFVISLLMAFIIYFVLLSNDIWFVYKSIIFFLTTFVIVNMCLWSIDYSFRERIVVALAIGILLSWAEIVLSVWPIEPTYSSLILDLLFYFALNIAMEMREKLGRYIWLEYALLYTFILLVLILLGEWGINGYMF